MSVVAAGYKLTEVGVIPESWEVMRLGQLADFVTSGSRGWAQFYSEGGALFIRSQNVKAGRLDFSDRQHVVQPAGAEGNRTRVQQRDLLVTITGNSVGNVALVEHDLGEAYISQHVGLIRFQEPALASFVARYLAPGAPGNWQIAASQSGQSKPGLTLKDLHEFAVVLPEAAEQRAIAETLSDMDALLAGLDRLIAKKRDLKQAAMQQLLTGQTRLPGFQGDWEWKQVGDVAAISKGTQLHGSEAQEGGAFPHLNGGITPSNYTNKSNTAANTIAVSEGGNSCGFVQFMRVPYWCGGHCYSVIPKGVDNKFLYQLLKGRQLEIMALRVGSGLPNVQKAALLAVKVRCPIALAEQTAIAAVLSDMDAELTTLEARRDKTRALKQGMMQELLIGRTRLV